MKLAAVGDINDKKLLRLVRDFQSAFDEALSEGDIVTLPARLEPPM